MNDTHANAGKDLGGQGPGGQGLGKGSGGVVVGIDLGTTNSLVAICDERGPRVLVGGGDGGGGGGLIPSVVRVEGVDGQGRPVVTVGRDAKERAAEFPARTIASIKRLMGRGVREAQSDAAYLTYELSPGPRDTARAKVRVDGREVVLSPEEVSAMILREVKRVAEEALGTRVERAVITVPAYFDDAQRQATRVAARLAGLEAVRIVPEPTAAALAYGIGLRRAKERNAPEQSHVCVYDLGGGTFDVSVLRLTPAEAEGETDFYQVLASAGDTHLGGDDVDHLLVDLFTREVRERLGVEAGASPALARTLLARAEEAKIELSSRERVRVRVETDKGPYEREVTRAELEALIAPLVDRTMEACARALADARRAGLPEGPLDAVVLVGGSTRIPLVRARVREFFGLEPYTALDPDRVVALGASVQGAILSGGRGGALLLDVIPLSLGVETVGGGVAKLILRNSPVPSRATEMFSTSVDNQTAIRLTVYQGEREMASDCRKLGEFTLRGIPPMPAGVPQVRVMFAVDANGVLSVTASERRSGKQASLQVVPNHGLTEEEVRAIERESVVHAREDMQRHRIADLITSAKLDAHWIGSKLAAHRGLLEEAYAKGLEARLEEVRGLAARGAADWRSVDANAFQKAKEALERESMRLQEIAIAQVLRERAASEGGGDGRAGGSGGSGGGQG